MVKKSDAGGLPLLADLAILHARTSDHCIKYAINPTDDLLSALERRAAKRPDDPFHPLHWFLAFQGNVELPAKFERAEVDRLSEWLRNEVCTLPAYKWIASQPGYSQGWKIVQGRQGPQQPLIVQMRFIRSVAGALGYHVVQRNEKLRDARPDPRTLSQIHTHIRRLRQLLESTNWSLRQLSREYLLPVSLVVNTYGTEKPRLDQSFPHRGFVIQIGRSLRTFIEDPIIPIVIQLCAMIRYDDESSIRRLLINKRR